MKIRTIFIRTAETIDKDVDKWNADKAVCVVSDYKDRDIILHVPGRTWKARHQEWWFSVAQLDLIIKALPHYRLHSSIKEELARQEAKQVILERATKTDLVN